MSFRRIFLMENFILSWVGSDWWFNSYLLRQPYFGGKFSHYIEMVHWWLFGAIGAVVAWKESKSWFLLIFIWCFMDEWLQNFLPMRVPSLTDCVRNVIGFLSGYLIIDIARQVKRYGMHGEDQP